MVYKSHGGKNQRWNIIYTDQVKERPQPTPEKKPDPGTGGW
jgi:hypothetical protein